MMKNLLIILVLAITVKLEDNKAVKCIKLYQNGVNHALNLVITVIEKGADFDDSEFVETINAVADIANGCHGTHIKKEALNSCLKEFKVLNPRIQRLVKAIVELDSTTIVTEGAGLAVLIPRTLQKCGNIFTPMLQ